MKDTLKAIIGNVENVKLSDSKAALMMLEVDSGLPENISQALLPANAARTKAAFAGCLSDVVELLEAQEPLPVEETQPLTALDELKVEITKTLQDTGKASFHLGKLLVEAREVCETQAEFLEWVDVNFGIKKAWAFKLMKVATVFKDEEWHGVAAGVLYTLQSQADETQMMQARHLARKGELNAKTLSQLLSPPAPATKPAGQATAPDALETLAGAAQDVSAAGVFDAGADVVITLNPAKLSDDHAPNASQQPAPAAESANTEALQELSARLSEVLAQNAELQRKLQELQAPKLRIQNAPMLRQFHSADLKVRLGLTAEEAKDKATILDAFKDLCRAGYGRGHEAFELLDEARHELIHAI